VNFTTAQPQPRSQNAVQTVDRQSAPVIHFIDIAIPVLGAILAAILVLRWGIWGFFAGVAAFWLCVVLRVELLMKLRPEHDAPMSNALAMILAVPLGTIWCLLFLIGRTIYQRSRRLDLNRR
jgi:hypothetical protein